MGYLYGFEEDIFTFFVIVVIAAFIILAIFVNVIYPIIEDREYIKMEMNKEEIKICLKNMKLI